MYIDVYFKVFSSHLHFSLRSDVGKLLVVPGKCSHSLLDTFGCHTRQPATTSRNESEKPALETFWQCFPFDVVTSGGLFRFSGLMQEI